LRGSDVRAVGAVIGSLPEGLRTRLPRFLPAAVADAIRVELDRGVTGAELTARADRRWFNHGYAGLDPALGGSGILRPVGVAVALVRRGNCPSARCDDGTDLDTGALCRTCEREAEDRRAAQEGPVQGAFLTSVQPAPWATVPAQQTPLRRREPGWLPLVTCDGCELAHRAENPGDLCGVCRREREAQQAEQAGQGMAVGVG